MNANDKQSKQHSISNYKSEAQMLTVNSHINHVNYKFDKFNSVLMLLFYSTHLVSTHTFILNTICKYKVFFKTTRPYLFLFVKGGLIKGRSLIKRAKSHIELPQFEFLRQISDLS